MSEYTTATIALIADDAGWSEGRVIQLLAQIADDMNISGAMCARLEGIARREAAERENNGGQ